MDEEYVVRDLKSGKDLGVFPDKFSATAFGRTLQKDKVPRYRLVVEHRRSSPNMPVRTTRRYLNAAFDYTANNFQTNSGSFTAPSIPSGEGTSLIEPTPTPTPTTPSPGLSDPVSSSLPQEGVSIPIKNESRMPANDNQAAAQNAIAETNDAMTSDTDFDSRLLLGGAAAGIGAAGIAYDLSREEESVIRRTFSRNKTEARKVFKEEFEIIADSKSKSDLKTLLEVDFSRRGPLYQAFQKDKLALTPDRSGWVIEKNGVFLPYTSSNFGKERGFSTLQQQVETYIYSNDGLILPRQMFRSRITSGQYTDFKNIDASGNLLIWDGKQFINQGPAPAGSIPGTITFIDQRGNTQTVMTGSGSTFIPSLNNTLEGYYNRVPYEPDKKTEEEILSDAVREARAKIANLESERNSLDGTGVLDADAFIRNLGREDVSDQRIERQKKAEEAQKKRFEAAKKKAEKDAKDLEAARLAQVQAVNDNLAKSVEDISVNKSRFKLDLKYVTSYVESG